MEKSYANLESIENIHEQLKKLSNNDNIHQLAHQGLELWRRENARASLSQLKADVAQIAEEMLYNFFPQDPSYTKPEELSDLVSAYVHSETYDTIFSCLKATNSKEDLHLYKISKEFCRNNGTPKQLGTTFYNFIPNAAVVELSMIGSKTTPMEKLKNLQLTYDYIFAEVKGALISVISKYSEKEVELPFMDNKEAFPIVMAVILKSKLFYFVSELNYIKEFGFDFIKNLKEFREIYEVFNSCVEQIFSIKPTTSDSDDAEKLANEMSVCDAIKFIESQNREDKSESQTIFNEEQDRLARLITSATTEHLQIS
ncbi:uncharacterized protein [Euwallacea fornicatus]|uniref:uncharacterized protein n=1 Tax=Euwallacea fornicatus TaxID=995702 RepID=UPI00338DEE12